MTRVLPLPAAVLLAASVSASCSRPTDLPPDFDARVAAPASVAAGRQIFLRDCALCHGERGNGQGVRASAFSVPPRDFTDQVWRESTSPRRVFRAIRDGLPGTPMPSWRTLGDDALIDLTAYVLSIGKSR